MATDSFQLTTPRLVLRRWHDNDRSNFRAMLADEEVMRDQGGPVSHEEADHKLDRYADAFDRYGYGRLAVERTTAEGASEFIGYVGVMPMLFDHPLGKHDEIGWRLTRPAWGHGYATEAAQATLDDALHRVGLPEVLSYTAPDNYRSQAVMGRLGLRRDADRDFHAQYNDVGEWHGLVWVADHNWQP